MHLFSYLLSIISIKKIAVYHCAHFFVIAIFRRYITSLFRNFWSFTLAFFVSWAHSVHYSFTRNKNLNILSIKCCNIAAYRTRFLHSLHRQQTTVCAWLLTGVSAHSDGNIFKSNCSTHSQAPSNVPRDTWKTDPCKKVCITISTQMPASMIYSRAKPTLITIPRANFDGAWLC